MMGTEKELEQQLLGVTKQFLQESHAERAARSLSETAELEKDLGIGSLEKAELFHRIEKHFNTELPESLLVSAGTLKDIKSELLRLSKISKINYKQVKTVTSPALKIDLTKVKTLVDVLVLYEKYDRDRPYLYLQQEESERIITYGELYDMSVKVAKGLKQLKIAEGDMIAIMLPSSAEFFFAFYGILLAGCVPVPIYPPMRLDQIEEYAHKEAKILYNAGVKVLISFKQAKPLNKLLQPFVPTLTDVTDVDSLIKADGPWKIPEVEADDIALLQYTSGSTGNPKGVTLTHANLIANIRAYGVGAQVKPDDVVVSWLPLYHDMGLIGTVMGCLFYGIPLILMSPLSFLARPEKWLWTIHYRRATLSAAPNFAYELCAKKIEDETLEGLDLSSWRLAFNGAEAIHPRTLAVFHDRFKKYGFSRNVFFPVYGLAESSVALTFPPIGREPRIDRIDKEHFEKEQKAVSVTDNSEGYYEFVSCGSALQGHKIRVVDDHNRPLPEREIGNLQFCGPSSMQGYYRNTDATEAIYHEGWWDSGDLAYLADDEVFITGRKKDLIIKAGRNYYPQEIEDVASDVRGVRKGCVAAFGVMDKSNGTEKLVVVAERSQRDKLDKAEMIDEIISSVSARVGVAPDDVVIAEPRSIPKTSSGKLRRSSCKSMYENGNLSGPAKSTALQFVKLFFAGGWRRIKKYVNVCGRFLYTLYVSSVFLIVFIPARLIMTVLSRESSAKLAQKFCRFLLVLAFCRLNVVGKKIIAKGKPKIFVANHTSYVDVVVLMAVLPSNVRFVGKQELQKVPVLGGLLKKLGHIFIDRVDITKNESDMAAITNEIDQGNPVLFFPEGTFTRVTGVRPFKLGPFKLGAQKNISIYPVAIKNARGILRANSFLFSPKHVCVTLLTPKMSQSDDWQDIANLRDEVRKEISDHCGEKPIDLIVAGVEKT